MRAALISIAGQPRNTGSGTPLRVAGKSLARRQLDFALAAGCELVVALGDGSASEAITLRHAAEAAGARFQAVRDAQALLGLVRAADELLVLAPGLLPEASAALDLLGKGSRILVLPAAQGVAAGFERIDLERAWAGALVLPGALVERLAELPADIEPTSALLRLALQAHASERRLPEECLIDGSWALIGNGADPAASERAWLKRHLPPSGSNAFVRRLSDSVVSPLASRLLDAPRSVSALVAGAAAVLAGAVIAAWYGVALLGFALVALGAGAATIAAGMARLREAPFVQSGRSAVTALLPWLVDAALAGCAVLAIEGSWLHRLFPPIVLLMALHAARPGRFALLSDRAPLAVLVALAAAFGLAEPAIMLASLALIAFEAAQTRAGTRITPV